MSALEGLVITPEMAMVSAVLRNTPRARLHPVILKLLTAWNEEPERILAFFIRDNPELKGKVNYLMALDLLTEWPQAMKEHAIEQDSFAKMMVLTMADCPVSDNPVSAFRHAVENKKYGLAIWALTVGGKQIAASVGREWHKSYLKLEMGGHGPAYMAAQLLNGTVARCEPNTWQEGLIRLAAAKGDPELVGYFKQQGQHYAENSGEVMEALIVSHWSGYPSDSEQEEDDDVPGQSDMNVAALQGAESNPTAAMLKVVYDKHPDRAHLLPIVQALQGCWHSDPARILAFFMRDNRALIPRARELMGLDVLDWVDPMWQHAVASDSWARFAVLVMALGGNPETPRQPPAGFIEAIADKHYEIAAAYMSFYGNVVGPGVSDRWTQLYWSLFETGEPAAVATAQMLNGMMKRHGKRAWDRDIGRLAKKLSESKKAALDTCLGYLSSEADHFADTSQIALQAFVLPQWEAYRADDHDDVEEDDESEADAVDAIVSTYLALADQERAGLPKEVLKSFLGMAQGLASMAGLDRDTIARAVINSGRTSQSAKDVVRDLKRLNIGV